jgi:hypothetical protein
MNPQTQLALELLIEYYGEDYISSPLDLIELMKTDCDTDITVKEATFIINNLPELVDKYKTMELCGVI